MAACCKQVATREARSAITKWAIGFGVVDLLPLAHLVMDKGAISLVIEVGSIFDVYLDRTEAKEIIETVMPDYLNGHKVAHGILDLIPGVGWKAKSIVGMISTLEFGDIVIDYFNDYSDLPD
ncbi:hypothetical protein [Okeania sp. KiyG1]|uniref:hypothetical protein n=1 Tax=Okeania sp. KiyG1 TaxID=2720165 RepID=UPI0019217B8E|nr:hypothetical protein [Okeania sp. KiyG1]GGA47845.1 hypothetical protein CYANOKiyG1_66970 [Okeania sp. KiyG1]